MKWLLLIFVVVFGSERIIAQVDAQNGSHPAIEIYNEKTGKSFKITSAKKVKVQVRDSKGKLVAKQALLVAADEYTLTFKPLNDKLDSITYCYNCESGGSEQPLRHIAFYTQGSIVRGILVPAALAGGIILVATSPGGQAILFGSVLILAPVIELVASGNNSGKRPGSFRRHVNFSPVSLWKIRLAK